jgi:hypothetical protein
MEHTLEVRWFYDGLPPDDVVAWFSNLNPAQHPVREDLYLISDDPSLNVKWRNGRIELKRRSGDRVEASFAEGVQGTREEWQKWSFPLTKDAPNIRHNDPSSLWLAVEKSRLQRVYKPSEQRALLGTLDEPDPANALVELTRVTCGDCTAWTICMEAKGPAHALPGTLRQMGRFVFSHGIPLDLSPLQSFGYVRWLERITWPSSAPSEDQ